MADTDPSSDPGNPEYYRRRRIERGGGDYEPPSSPPHYPAVPPGQIGTESGLLGTIGREAVIAGNQAGIGIVGLPAGAANLLWKGAHWADPNDVGEPPAILQAQGPGSYGEALTIPGFNPMTPFERTLAAGARQAGSALPFVLTGAMGPVGLGINALGGGGGQALTEAGHPNLGAAVQFGTGLASGLGSASRMPGAAPASSMWSNVPRTTPLSAREISALREKNIDDYIFWEPITRWMGPGGLGVNYMIRRRNLNAIMGGGTSAPSPATMTAQRILGGGVMGSTVGGASAMENAPPPISYSAPPSFAPSGGN